MTGPLRLFDLDRTIFNVLPAEPRKTSEDLLRQAQANLRAIIENSSVTIYSLDREFRYVIFNSLLSQTIRKVYGLEIKAGDVVFDFLYKDDPQQAEEWRSIYSRALNGETLQFVKEFALGDYQSFVKFYINPIKEGQEVSGLSCLAIDITKERLAELNTSRSESKFRALIENNTDAIMVRDENRNLVYASPAMTRMLGLTPGPSDTLKMADIVIHPHDVATLGKLYQDAAKSPDVPFAITMRVKHNMGHYIWIEGVLTNMLDNENVRGYVANFRDVTQRKQSELQSQRISKELAKRNENLEQYAYIVSHNLRSPVANLLGLANLLEMSGANSQDSSDARSHIISSARKLDEVIKDLSDILQAGDDVNLIKETVGFQELVDNVRSSIGNKITGAGASIEVDFAEVSGIIAIKSFVYSIFYNLISNSIKYRKPGIAPLIRIKSRQLNDIIQLTFEDNGLGIDLEKHGDKLFGLYKRFHHDAAPGKGMGLFMVKTQVENLGGRISVESVVDKGTTFTIALRAS